MKANKPGYNLLKNIKGVKSSTRALFKYKKKGSLNSPCVGFCFQLRTGEPESCIQGHLCFLGIHPTVIQLLFSGNNIDRQKVLLQCDN
jgi:hypothetical protein